MCESFSHTTEVGRHVGNACLQTPCDSLRPLAHALVYGRRGCVVTLRYDAHDQWLATATDRGSSGSIVAKVADDPATVLGKLFGNPNRIVDVYDASLARDENFGALLCALSRFMTHQRKYRRNRIQEVLLANAGPSRAERNG